ncbi:ABC transporter ATP-binding protein [Nocardia sp. NPDC056100]|uniref:ABC transporter ATP-binding protein n=1 Tax=Nocardia sp. NPDC056100 TaxID=3345712 RepID=UPI0035D60579
MTDQLISPEAVIDRQPLDETGSGTIELTGVTKKFGANPVFADLDLLIPDGSFTVLVGPSGCGKSTMLRAIAGLEGVDAGQIHIGGREVTTVPARDRKLAMVFQDFALYPHMTVEKNITFGLRLQARHDKNGPTPADIRTRTAEVVEMLGLSGLEQRMPSQLSGGQQQRVALARAIVKRPRAFLMDEPLSSLDAKLRGETRAELVRLHRQLGTTFVYVTHDQLEALSMATRLIVLDGGRISQAGAPDEVYTRPANMFVAAFVGTPPMNFHEVDIHSAAAGSVIAGEGIVGRLDARSLPGRVFLGWRPGHGMLGDSGEVEVTGQVDVVEHLGDTKQVTCVHGDQRWVVVVPATTACAPGQPLRVSVPAERVHLFDAVTRQRIDPAP